ncbi:MAG: hypothetical protein IJ244_08380 [Bacteroidaceae bacterium]|nr:hypothetical protein [Bacteroidaceae bacterium]
MKTLRISIILLIAIIGLGACGDDEPETSSFDGSSNSSDNITVDKTFAASTEGDVQTFTVNLDSTALQNETEIIPTDYAL